MPVAVLPLAMITHVALVRPYLLFRNGRPVRLFKLTILPDGMPVWRPDFGFFLLKK